MSRRPYMHSLFCSFTGYRTASVIIALTDGELRETQFDLAAREVRKRKKTGPVTKTFFHMPFFSVGGGFLKTVPISDFLLYYANRHSCSIYDRIFGFYTS